MDGIKRVWKKVTSEGAIYLQDGQTTCKNVCCSRGTVVKVSVIFVLVPRLTVIPKTNSSVSSLESFCKGLPTWDRDAPTVGRNNKKIKTIRKVGRKKTKWRKTARVLVSLNCQATFCSLCWHCLLSTTAELSSSFYYKPVTYHMACTVVCKCIVCCLVFCSGQHV